MALTDLWRGGLALVLIVVSTGSLRAADPAPDVVVLGTNGEALRPVGLRKPLQAPTLRFPPAVSVDGRSGILMAIVSEAGNAPDASGLGAVAYPYAISVYEITNAQFVELLTAVAADDPNGLFNESIMTDSDRGGILRSGTPGSYTFTVKPNFDLKPANGMSWLDSARFCNWLHNGKPAGAQGPATTEDGAYDLSVSPGLVTRRREALYFIPTHDEWYKAAYYDPFDSGADAGGTPDYWLYPTRSDSVPVKATANAVGDVTNPGPNVANLDRGAAWNGENGNVTTVGGTLALNAWGVFDLAGNVNEQTETPGTPIPPGGGLPTRRIRGGDFANVEILASSPPGFSGSLNMQAEAANIGFRVGAQVCLVPEDPLNLVVSRRQGDVILGWDDPNEPLTWNVYREALPDPSFWGAPHATNVVDEDPIVPGIQFRDVGAIFEGSLLFYRVTAVNECGESPTVRQ